MPTPSAGPRKWGATLPKSSQSRVAGRPKVVVPEQLGIDARTREDLERFIGLLRNWQRTHNLIAPSTLDQIWTRHVADSLQLLTHAPPAWREWVDLGSGAGFPGLVVAIAVKGEGKGDLLSRLSRKRQGHAPPLAGRKAPDQHVTLVESNQKKAAFLRAALRETKANASVAAERIEDHALKMAGGADVVSARALAPLPALCRLAYPYLHAESVMLLLKGQDFVHELNLASKAWHFDVVESPSGTDPGGRILAIRNLRPKVQR